MAIPIDDLRAGGVNAEIEKFADSRFEFERCVGMDPHRTADLAHRNARSGLGNVLHFDVAVPLSGQPGIDSVQFLVETRHSF
jgi:hypothetical protein